MGAKNGNVKVNVFGANGNVVRLLIVLTLRMHGPWRDSQNGSNKVH